MCFSLFYYQDIIIIILKKKCSSENFGIKTKRLCEFSNKSIFLHAHELSMESIRVATTVPVAVQ